VIWSDEASDELPARADNRRLVLDYFATRCCGRNISIGDLHLRWTASDEPMPEEFVPLRAPAGIEAYVQRDLVLVLESAGGRIAMRGWEPFRRPCRRTRGRRRVARLHWRLPDTQPAPSLIDPQDGPM
jgi:hypothetical protein